MEKILNPEWINLPIPDRKIKMIDTLYEIFEDTKANRQGYACLYKSEGDMPGCHIGIFIPDDDCEILDNMEAGIKDIMSGPESAYDFLIPDWMKEMGGDFLHQIQMWHDEIVYDNNETGKRRSAQAFKYHLTTIGLL